MWAFHPRHPVFLALLLSIAATSVPAQEPADPIREQLARVLREHDAVAASTDALLSGELDAKVKAVGATGNVDALKKVAAEKATYVTAGVVPAWATAIPAVRNTMKSMAEADARLDAAYRAAELAYTRAMKFDQAEAIRAERLDAKHPPVPATPVVATPSNAGSVQESARVPNPATGPVDLMPLIHVEKDALGGRWSRTKNGLVCDNSENASLRIRHALPEEYDFIMEFTRNDGSRSVGQLCWGYGHRFRWALGSAGNTVCGIDRVNGTEASRGTASVAMGLENGRRYSSIVQVRKDRILCYLDDRLLASLKTDYSDLDFPCAIEPGTLGIITGASGGGSFTIHRLAITEITGDGRKPKLAPSRQPSSRTFTDTLAPKRKPKGPRVEPSQGGLR